MNHDESFLINRCSCDFSSGQIFIDGRLKKYRRKNYPIVTVGGKVAYAHRLVWRLYYGKWATQEIDHIDRNRRNYSISNLRLASPSQNCCNQKLHKNNKSGERCVCIKVAKRMHLRWYVSVSFGRRAVCASQGAIMKVTDKQLANTAIVISIVIFVINLILFLRRIL